uniref:Uncharacterized protein n=1 Tax=Cacopsylla melanoneura TaxID=428564 RepID=A0A8D8V225_9HEMI
MASKSYSPGCSGPRCAQPCQKLQHGRHSGLFLRLQYSYHCSPIHSNHSTTGSHWNHLRGNKITAQITTKLPGLVFSSNKKSLECVRWIIDYIFLFLFLSNRATLSSRFIIKE